MYPELIVPFLPAISTYYLVISASCVVSALWFIRRAEAAKLARVTAIDLTLLIFTAGFLGARLLHVAFEEPEFYRAHPWAIFYVWNGGFVYLGGLVAAFFAASYFCAARGEPFWTWADVAAPPIGFGYALGRLGCLLNGCCYGRECRLPWAIHLHGADRHPTQLYATLWNLAAVGLLLLARKRFRRSGALFHAWVIAFALGRIVMEIFRDDPRGPGILGLSLSLWLSLVIAIGATCNWLRQP